MKKLLFMLLIVVFCMVGHQGAQAETNKIDVSEYVTANKKDAADQNAYNWNDLMRKLDSAEHTTIYVPKGVFYFSQTLAIPSNVTVIGEDAGVSSLVFTKVVAGITVRFPVGEMKAHTIGLEKLKISYDENAPDEKNSSLISFGTPYEELNYEDYQVMDNVTIRNCIIDGKKKGSSAIYLGRVSNVTISKNTIQNSGLQNGITLEFCKNAQIDDNDISDLGRSGIQMYKHNGSATEPIIIERNRITNWMQRYGYEHFKTKYEAGKVVDVMNDAGIDSYGPQNENLIIKGNILTAGRVNSYNPSNTKILAEYGEEVYQEHVIFFTGIRLCGVKDVIATGNEVDLKGRDIFTLMYINSREKAATRTKPSNIIVDQNSFKAEGNVRYPVRIFDGETAENENKDGVTFINNDFTIEGKLVDNGYFSFFTVSSSTKKLHLIGNKINMTARYDYLVSVSDNEYDGEKVKLHELVATLNMMNGELVKSVRGNIGTVDYAHYLQDKPLFTHTNVHAGQYLDPVWKVRLIKDGLVIKQADTDTKMKTYTFKGLSGLVQNDDSKYELVGVDLAYKEVLRIPLEVRWALEAPAYIVGTNEYRGTYGGTVAKVRILKNGLVLKQADSDGSAYGFKDMKSLILDDGSKYEILGVDNNYKEVVRVPLVVKSILDVPEYTVGERELGGEYRENIQVVRLFKDGKLVKQGDLDIATGTYKLKGIDTIVLDDGSKYEVVGLDAGYKEVVRIDLKVKALHVKLTPEPYIVGNSDHKGTYEEPIWRVRLLKDNVVVKQSDMDTATKTYILKGLNNIVKNDGSKYELIGIDSSYREIVRMDFKVGI
ncbi:right-handed parallel beta-helix repeat-containing protein [Paenilisteria weihenstephanensis]|uniref:right-handed parallel beta-helix repeat-containing protein n=1 Tax=Listeria weihenstephanensis TaxID=1006155 RepID=UPI001627501E|nr:right-handed parallel beta-helix repeat-containing protein [Listeria weihenstephanensis]